MSSFFNKSLGSSKASIAKSMLKDDALTPQIENVHEFMENTEGHNASVVSSHYGEVNMCFSVHATTLAVIDQCGQFSSTVGIHFFMMLTLIVAKNDSLLMNGQNDEESYGRPPFSIDLGGNLLTFDKGQWKTDSTLASVKDTSVHRVLCALLCIFSFSLVVG